jgi:hypothetical protein
VTSSGGGGGGGRRRCPIAAHAAHTPCGLPGMQSILPDGLAPNFISFHSIELNSK